jgi:methylmalonyl-CoA/ethylmalonyl-CoA epimerase
VRLHHLGFACEDLAQARQTLLAQWPGWQASAEVHDPGQDATLCLLSGPQAPAYELVAGPAVSAMLKKGLALYHVCYEVDDLPKAVAQMEAQGYRLVREALPAPLFNGRQVAFVHGLLGLVELLEKG